MIWPKAIAPGATVGLIAPSGAAREPGLVEEAIEKIEGLGFSVKLGKSCGQVYGYLSGSDAVRAADANEMFLDDGVDAIFCLRGGYGTPRILDALDYEAARRHPKIFLGFSDITGMHLAYNQKSDLITFHGPMPSSTWNEFTLSHMADALAGRWFSGKIENPEGVALTCVQGGRATGRLIGGNLCLICALMGTPYEPDFTGKILFLEDVGERTYRLDRLLTQLRLSGAFDKCAGVVLGDFHDCPVEYPEFGLTLDQIVRDVIVPSGKPILAGLSAGHCPQKLTLPLGACCELDAESLSLRILDE